MHGMLHQDTHPNKHTEMNKLNYLNACTYTATHISVGTKKTHIHTSMHDCMHACMHACKHTCVHTCACIHLDAHVYMCIYIRLSIYIQMGAHLKGSLGDPKSTRKPAHLCAWRAAGEAAAEACKAQGVHPWRLGALLGAFFEGVLIEKILMCAYI